jgi:hypothetical protein
MRKLGPAPSVGFFEKSARERLERLSVEHAKSFECFVRFASKQQPFIFSRATELFGTELFDPPPALPLLKTVRSSPELNFVIRNRNFRCTKILKMGRRGPAQTVEDRRRPAIFSTPGEFGQSNFLI